MLFKKIFLFIYLISLSLLAETKIGIYETQGSYIPLDLEFINEYDKKTTLKNVIDNKPTILTLNYFDCPGLCSPLLNGVVSVLNKLDLKPYIDYKVLTISFEKNDTPFKAITKKTNLLKSFKIPFPPQSWTFLTSANQEAIDTITNAVGFKYEKRVKAGVIDYIHAGMIIIISPTGKIIRYLNGTTYLPFDLKLAIYEAKEERSGPTIAKTLLYCFAYDAKSKTYVFQAEKIVGSFMFAIVFFFFLYLIKTGRRKNE
jgi:protein SCO1/2